MKSSAKASQLGFVRFSREFLADFIGGLLNKTGRLTCEHDSVLFYLSTAPLLERLEIYSEYSTNPTIKFFEGAWGKLFFKKVPP